MLFAPAYARWCSQKGSNMDCTDQSQWQCECELKTHNPKLVVLTGGPGAGKTAVLELVRKSMCEHVIVLPEAASIVFGGGFPRRDTLAARLGAQRAILHVQQQLEKVALEEGKAAIVLCDRGTVDGLAYWPGSEAEFWRELGTTRERALQRYAAVVHLRTPHAHQGYNQANPVRVESADQALRLDEKILAAWAGHPNRVLIESESDFLAKAAKAVEILRGELPECCRKHEIAGIQAK